MDLPCRAWRSDLMLYLREQALEPSYSKDLRVGCESRPYMSNHHPSWGVLAERAQKLSTISKPGRVPLTIQLMLRLSRVGSRLNSSDTMHMRGGITRRCAWAPQTRNQSCETCCVYTIRGIGLACPWIFSELVHCLLRASEYHMW
jgi:hypothetical protein